MAKVFTTVPDKVSGDVFSETMWDTHIRDNINNMIVPPAAGIRKAAVQSLANNTLTTFTFDTENFDTDTLHDNVTNNSRITYGTTGVYVVTAYASWAANTTGRREIQLFLSGVLGGAGLSVDRDEIRSAGVSNTSHGFSRLLSVAATGFSEMKGIQTSGVALDATCRFTAIWVGRTS